ncbi:MAG: right-handed parallel beta-helix repeat-containing protein [Verrucomicrobiota bacterium]
MKGYSFSLAVLFSVTQAVRAVLPILYDSNATDPNPVSQGWTASEIILGTDTSPQDGLIDAGFNAGPVDGSPESAIAWQFNDQLSATNANLPNYTQSLTTTEQNDLIADGWTLTARLKVVGNSPNSGACYIGWGLTTASASNNTGVNRRAGFYLRRVASDNSAEIFDDRGLNDTNLRINLGPNSADDYHLVQLRSDAPGSTLFSWSVNGIEQYSGIDILTAPFGTSGQLFWTSNSSDATGITNFLNVSLKKEFTYYVNQNASGAKDGTSWLDAFTDLQSALAAASSGNEIWVAEGTYRPSAGTDRNDTFQLVNGVTIYGGFDGTETSVDQRNPNPTTNGTILSGDLAGDDGPDFTNTSDNSYSIVTGSNTDETAILDGFTISGGNANGTSGSTNKGGALYNDHGSPTIRNCFFLKNEANVQFGKGGAVYNLAATPTFTSCLFRGNRAGFRGGAITNDSASPTLTNCLFEGNTSGVDGGAVDTISGSPSFTNCTFHNNATVRDGGAVGNNSSAVSFINCIIWGNFANGISNTSTASVYNDPATVATYSHCLIENFSKSSLDAGSSPNTNLAPSDPLFFSSANLRLQSDSPAIDAGDPLANTTLTDLDGNPRLGPLGTIDLGAYETYQVELSNLFLSSATGSETSIGTWAPDTTSFNEGSGLTFIFNIVSNTLYFVSLPVVDPDGTLRFTLAPGDDGSAVFDVFISDPSGTFDQSQPTTISIFLASTIYVDKDATGNDSGASWGDAFPNLQDALDFASQGIEIWVAEGTYYPDDGVNQTDNDRSSTFQLKNAVSIYGGFNGNETDRFQRNAEQHPTILSGDIGVPNTQQDNALHVLTGSSLSNNTVIDGFTITQGYAQGNHLAHENKGGGLLLVNGSEPTLSQLTFASNSARGLALFDQAADANAYGAALAIIDSNPTVIACQFLNNSVTAATNPTSMSGQAADAGTAYGGAVHLCNSVTTFEGCYFENNRARGGSGTDGSMGSDTPFGSDAPGGNGTDGFNGGSAYGGAFFSLNSTLTIKGSEFRSNFVQGGNGGDGGTGGDGGDGQRGTPTGSTGAYGGNGGSGGRGGHGGAAGHSFGGAIACESSTSTVTASKFLGNYTLPSLGGEGGRGGRGGDGGNGGRGADYNLIPFADGGFGGDGGDGGSGGRGGDGGDSNQSAGGALYGLSNEGHYTHLLLIGNSVSELDASAASGGSPGSPGNGGSGGSGGSGGLFGSDGSRGIAGNSGSSGIAGSDASLGIQNGGGGFFAASPTTLTNISAASNRAADGGSAIFSTNSSSSLSNSILFDHAGIETLGLTANGVNMFSSDNPLFVRNPNSGDGSWQSSADNNYGDLRLLTGSPALNMGDNALNSEPLDLAGNPRIQNTIIDLGAYEGAFTTFAHEGFTNPTADDNLNGLSNYVDYALGADPTAPNEPSVRPNIIGDQLTFSFRNNATDVFVEFQKSDTLLPNDWDPMLLGTDYTLSSETINGTTTTQTLNLLTSDAKLFFREFFSENAP